MAARKKEVTLKQLASELDLDLELVRNVLKEAAGTGVPKETQDRIFRTARKLGYDFRKLKIGKRMQYRKEALEETLEKIAEHPSWGRAEIVKHLKESLALVERVHRRVFQEEFGPDRE